MFMRSDGIHDAVLCAERRGRTPARSIDAAILARPYSRNCGYLMIICNLFSVALPPISLASPRQRRTRKKQNSALHFTLRSNRFSLREFARREYRRRSLRAPPVSDSRDATCCRRSEEHTSELLSLRHLVCRLL